MKLFRNKTILYICSRIINTMKKIFFFATLLSCSFTINAQNTYVGATDKVNKAEMVKAPTVESLGAKETEYNFGKIPQGKPVIHIFEVSNTGLVQFKLDNVQASCGCTTPEWKKDETIMPGKTAFITVGFNAGAEGAFAKPITVTYNGGQSKVLLIKGEVWKTPTTSAPINESLNELK